MQDNIEVISTNEVAKLLRIAPMKVKSAIKNGTMPIGCVCKEDGSTKERTVIIKRRWERWIDGDL